MKVNPQPRIESKEKRLNEEMRDHAKAINYLHDLVGNGAALPEYADDTAAATGGVSLYGFYRTGSAIKQRVA
jgi:hypothetical protein